jgi:nickel transport protein
MPVFNRCKRLGGALALLVGIVLCAAPAAQAHKVTVFAWVEGDTVHTESKFSGGRRVREAAVEVYGAPDRLLLSGQTDADGRFSFKIPEASALRIVVRAGMGHQNEWRLPEAEVRRGLDAAGALPAAGRPPVAAAASDPPPPIRPTSLAPEQPADLNAEALQRIVEDTLDRKLQPVLAMLAEARQPGPSLPDILGGLGYILGLVGLGAYLHSRRK